VQRATRIEVLLAMIWPMVISGLRAFRLAAIGLAVALVELLAHSR
jgi:hypothetical protein